MRYFQINARILNIYVLMTKPFVNNETTRARFKRLAAHRTQEVLKRLKILGNCSNRQFYSYDEKDVQKIFTAIEEQFRLVKMKFKSTNTKFKL